MDQLLIRITTTKQQGNTLFKQGKLDAALNVYKRAIELGTEVLAFPNKYTQESTVENCGVDGNAENKKKVEDGKIDTNFKEASNMYVSGENKENSSNNRQSPDTNDMANCLSLDKLKQELAFTHYNCSIIYDKLHRYTACIKSCQSVLKLHNLEQAKIKMCIALFRTGNTIEGLRLSKQLTNKTVELMKILKMVSNNEVQSIYDTLGVQAKIKDMVEDGEMRIDSEFVRDVLVEYLKGNTIETHRIVGILKRGYSMMCAIENVQFVDMDDDFYKYDSYKYDSNTDSINNNTDNSNSNNNCNSINTGSNNNIDSSKNNLHNNLVNGNIINSDLDGGNDDRYIDTRNFTITENYDRNIYVFGDTHGQFFDTFSSLKNIEGNSFTPTHGFTLAPRKRFVYNGDFVDRGSTSIENFIFILLMKILHPHQIFLNRGNHEFIQMNTQYGFTGEVQRKYPVTHKIVHEAFQHTFSVLPLVTLIDRKVFVVHGGLPRQFFDIEDVLKINRVVMINSVGQLFDGLMWSDPVEGRTGPSKRGLGVHFGNEITREFLRGNKLDMLVRSHEHVQGGYRVNHDGNVLTIFSAPDYCGQIGAGAYLSFGNEQGMMVNGGLRYEVKVFENWKFEDLEMVKMVEELGK